MLVALCRPLLDRDMFTEPASTRMVADELVITQAAVKQHLATIRILFDWLVTGGVVATNPAHAMRGPKHVAKRAKRQCSRSMRRACLPSC